VNEKCFKLTRPDRTTYNGYRWATLRWHETSGEGGLCGLGWLHAYTDPLLAVLLNPIHANLHKFVLWEARGAGERKDDRGLKVGYSRMRLIKKLPVPMITLEQMVRFAVFCSLEVYNEQPYVAWANQWLQERADRSDVSALDWRRRMRDTEAVRKAVVDEHTRSETKPLDPVQLFVR